MIPSELENALHPRADRELAERILDFMNATPAACVSDVKRAIRCSDVTALKHLRKMAKVGLVVEKRVGSARVFLVRSKSR